MQASRSFGQLTISFHALVILLSVFRRTESAITTNVSLLTTASIESVSSNDTRCCAVGGKASCSSATPSPRCAIDGNSSSVWTLSPNQLTVVTLTLKLNNSAILNRFEVTFDPSSIIPNSMTITAFNEGSDTDISLTTYFNKTCQPDDAYLRKQGPQYYSCLKYRPNQSWTASLPDGLLSVGDGKGGWLWWTTFQNVQVTVAATSDDYVNSTGTGMIAVSDIRLYGWNPPVTGCNCHPAGLSNIRDPCDQNGICKCRSPQINDQCIPNSDFTDPDYGPVSGGTMFFMTGNFLSNISAVTIGNTSQPFTIRSDNELNLTSIAANRSNIDNPLPILLLFYQPNIFYSFIIADSEFTFKPDPIVTSITPRRTILRGGILQTVYGQNLDSGVFPYVVIVALSTAGTTVLAQYPTTVKQIQSICQTINSTMLNCLTPSIFTDALPPLSDAHFNVSILYADINPSTNYTNCQYTDGNCGINVALDPTINQWNTVIDNPVGYPFYSGKRTMQITGNGFTYGNDGGDYTAEYTITVGNVTCVIVTLINNVIVFMPPDPKLITDTSKKQLVIVSIGYYNVTVGYLTYYLNWIDDPSNRNPLIGGLIGGIGGLIVVAIALFLIMRCVRRRRHPDEPLIYTIETIESYFPEDIKKYSVDFDRVELNDELGKGNFGKVYKGVLAKQDGTKEVVAIKTLHGQMMRFEEKLEFLQEAMVMADFCHDHVLALIAICIHDQKPYVILPLMEHGDLRGFVSKTNNAFTAGDLVNFSVQVAEGMEYLAGLKFVHRDLAARNCMINTNFLVKVADFGLARDIFEKDYYRSSKNEKPLPVKWMAIECLQGSSQFTEKSDVWSYGVLVWELMTRGKKPYCDVDNFALKRYLESGKRLEKPDSAPDFMYDLMQRCWLESRKSRPNFKEIVHELKSILSIGRKEEHSPPQNGSIDSNVAAEARRSYLQLD